MANKIVKKIPNENWTVSKQYKTAHEFADKEEKKKYGKDYKKLDKWIDKNTKPKEYVGMNFLSGKTEVEKKVPKKYRKEVEFHEKEELKKRKSLKK